MRSRGRAAEQGAQDRDSSGVSRLARTDGFTLLELLVAMAITLGLVGLLLGVAMSTSDLLHRAQGDLSANSAAKSTFDLLERDLHGAIARADGATWLAIDVLPDPASLVNHGWVTVSSRMKPAGDPSNRLLGDPADPDLATARFGLSGGWLRLVTTNVETAGSLPIAVAYQIARRPVTGAVSATNPVTARYTLYRSAVSADGTLADGYAVDAFAYQSANGSPGATRAASTLTNPSSEDALANNIVDFGVWLYVRNSDGSLRRIFPADVSDWSHAAQGATTVADGFRFPEVADVMLRILSEEGAALLENMEYGRTERPPQFATDADWWWGIVTSHSQVFVRRMVVGTPLP